MPQPPSAFRDGSAGTIFNLSLLLLEIGNPLGLRFRELNGEDILCQPGQLTGLSRE